MATPKKTTKSKGKTSSKSKSSSMTSAIKRAAKAAVIPGYGALSAAKSIDDYIEKKDPKLAKSKTYNAIKGPVKKAKGALDYVADKAESVYNVISNPGKYIEKAADKIGKYTASKAKAIDDYIEKVDPNLSKSKIYGALKGKAKGVVKSKAIEKTLGVAGKSVAFLNPLTATAIGTREGLKGAKAVGKYVREKARKGAKAIDDYVEKADPNLSKSKAYGKVEGTAKYILGVKSGSKTKKASTAKTSTTKKKTASTINPGDTGYVWGKNKNNSKTTTTTKKPTPKVTTSVPKAAPTVSELWKQKTGTSWSEAKKQGLTDGSASANIALMKKLKSGDITKSTPKPKETTTSTPTPEPMPVKKVTLISAPYRGSGMGAMERSEKEMEKKQFGGSAKSMKKAIGKTGSTRSSSGVTKPYKTGGPIKSKLKRLDDKIEKRYPNYTGKGSAYQAVKDAAKQYFKTGGMVNSNSKVSASRVAKGKVGGSIRRRK